MVCIQFETLGDWDKGEDSGSLLSGIHSGNAGDIVYSLPSVRALKIQHLILNVYRSPDPLRKLSKQSALALVPLLLAQPYLQRVTVVEAGVPLEGIDPGRINVDYVLDGFRLEPLGDMHLIHAHAKALHVDIDPNERFLFLPDDRESKSVDLVIAMTPRYRALTEEFVRQLALYFQDILVIALPEELRVVAGIAGTIHTCLDYLEMAHLIQAAPLFLGNPSLASAIAEGLKIHRMVDLPLTLANAFPIGPRGYVVPTDRSGFLDIVGRLRLNAQSTALHSDLREALRHAASENQRLRRVVDLAAEIRARSTSADETGAISLLDETEYRRTKVTGNPTNGVMKEFGRILLHPNAADSAVEASLRIYDIAMAGQNYFQADIKLDHAEAQSVCFIFRLRTLEGELLAEDMIQLGALVSTTWRVPLGRNHVCAVQIELATRMAPGATDSSYAWAWFQNPVLLVE